jgi:hypothetical protein
MLAADLSTDFDKGAFLAKIALEGEGPVRCAGCCMRRGVERTVSVSERARGGRTPPGRNSYPQQVQTSESRTLIGRFFIDLRRALRLTLPQAAYYVQVHPDIIEVLETGQIEQLPPWPETARIVMVYASMAGVDGRPVLQAIANMLSDLTPAAPEEAQWSKPSARTPAEASRSASQSSGRFRRAGSALASGAKRLPQGAMHQIRQRPQRALYALSLPLALLLLLLHTSIFNLIARPFSSTVRSVSVYFQEHFSPVRDGLRYIEVDDPRSRRADKLQITSGSY